MSYSGTVTCSHCYRQGHNKRKCPELTKRYLHQYQGHAMNAKESRERGDDSDAEWYENAAEAARKEYIKRAKIDPATGKKVSNKAAKAERLKTVRCSYCQERGHTRRTCESYKRDKQIFIEQTRRERNAALQHAREMGIGIGSMVPIRASGYDANNEWRMRLQLRYIKRIDWAACVANKSSLAAYHVEARHLAAPNSARWTSRDSLIALNTAFGEARDHARAEDLSVPNCSLVPALEPPAGWLTPSEQSLKVALQGEFPTTGNQYNKRRNHRYIWPKYDVQEIAIDLGLAEHYPPRSL